MKKISSTLLCLAIACVLIGIYMVLTMDEKELVQQPEDTPTIVDTQPVTTSEDDSQQQNEKPSVETPQQESEKNPVLTTPTSYSEVCEILVKTNKKTSIDYQDFTKYNSFNKQDYSIVTNEVKAKDDDFYAIKAAHECANRYNLPIVLSTKGTYNIYDLLNESPIIIRTNTDLKNSVFRIHNEYVKTMKEKTVKNKNVENFNSIFQVTTKNDPIKIGSNQKVKLFSYDLNTNKFSTLEQYFTGKKKYVILEGMRNDSFNAYYRFSRSKYDSYKYTDMFILNSDGSIIKSKNEYPGSPRTYGKLYDSLDVTIASIYEYPERKITIKNGNFYTWILGNSDKDLHSSNTGISRNISVRRSNTRLENINHYYRVKGESTNYYGFMTYQTTAFISFNHCADIEYVNSTVAIHKKIDSDDEDDGGATYELSTMYAVNTTFNNIKVEKEKLLYEDEYWPFFENNFSKNIVLENVKFNGFSTHRGAHGLTVKNSIIGRGGFKLTGSGTLNISNSTVKSYNLVDLCNVNYGLNWEGNIVITDTKYISNSQDQRSYLIKTPLTKTCTHTLGHDSTLPKVKITNLTVTNNPNVNKLYDKTYNDYLACQTQYNALSEYKMFIPKDNSTNFSYNNITVNGNNITLKTYK